MPGAPIAALPHHEPPSRGELFDMYYLHDHIPGVGDRTLSPFPGSRHLPAAGPPVGDGANLLLFDYLEPPTI